MNAESYIVLMIAGWLLISAAMLWGMLRIARAHAQRAHLKQCAHVEKDVLEAAVPQTPLTSGEPKRRKSREPRVARAFLPSTYRHLPH